MGIGSFPGVKRPDRGVDQPHHLASRLKKKCSYTSALLTACSRVNVTRNYLMFSANGKSTNPRRPNKHNFIKVHTPATVFWRPVFRYYRHRISNRNFRYLKVLGCSPSHDGGGAYEDAREMDNKIFDQKLQRLVSTKTVLNPHPNILQ